MKHPVPIGDLSRYQWTITEEGWRAILKAREELLAERRTARGQQRQAQAGKEEARKKEASPDGPSPGRLRSGVANGGRVCHRKG